MKKVLSLVVALILLGSGICFAAGGSDYSANASSVIVSLTATDSSRDVTFPYTSRNIYIRNYDTGGCFVSLKGGDTDPASTTNEKRIYIGASGSVDLLNFASNGVTIFNDNSITANQEASPIVVTVTW